MNASQAHGSSVWALDGRRICFQNAYVRASGTSAAVPARGQARFPPAPADTLRMDPARRHIGTAPQAPRHHRPGVPQRCRPRHLQHDPLRRGRDPRPPASAGRGATRPPGASGSRRVACLRAQFLHDRAGRRRERHAEPVRREARAAGAVHPHPVLELLDAALHVSPQAVDPLVEALRAAARVGHHVARVPLRGAPGKLAHVPP